MPSRKRSQGQARKSKHNALQRLVPEQVQERWPRTCMHGLNNSNSINVKQAQICHTFYDSCMSAWVEEMSGAAVKDLTAFYKKIDRENFPELYNRTNRDFARAYLLWNGINEILEDNKGLNSHLAACATAIQMLEFYSDQTISDQDSLQHQDVINGCERSTVKFYYKRISCSCLDTKYEEMKCQPKKGVCSGCDQYKDRSTLRVCAGCNRHQYCSRKCQIDDLPNHKAMCKHLQRSARNT